ncbi:MAG: sigma-70 family RNA polymerase sigma factor, partial [Lachnospiraceae bacterium]|nr:sigma-70 family RNA polymerase sigma factor [Lachnospiraceae bacterium]
FEELYRQTYSTVYFTCLSFLKNEQDAADMTQEVYVTVLGSLSTLEDHSKFLPWLNKIAVNKCKDRLKAAKAFPMDMEEENQPVEENENFLPEEYITNQAKRRIVMDIMKNRLTEAQYQTVIMFYFNEFTAQEISEIMECPIGTVTYRLSAAREKIRQGVSEYENKNHDKLYSYAVAVPLLAGVLTAEAFSLNVQAAAADAASITNAAPITKAANTSKGGTIKKMLKTPKTMIAATAAAVVIIGGITAAVIATNHENTPSSGAQTRQESPQVSSGTETNQENPQASSDTDDNTFWLHRVDWGEEKDLTGITLFNGECTAPIHLEDFDGDEHLAPYCGGGYNVITYSDKLTDLLDSNQPIEYSEIRFYPQCTYDEVNQTYIELGDESPSTISTIYLFDYSGEHISFRQAYENNWFYITAHDDFINEFNFDDRAFLAGDENDAIFDAMIDKYGRPSYVMAYDPSYLDESEETFLETFEKNNGTIEYHLVWEKNDFVLVLPLREDIRVDEKSHIMYTGAVGAGNADFVYVSAEAWPYYKEHNYNYEGFTIYNFK